MTAWIVLAAARRRWRLGLVGILLTALALGWAVTTRGVYYSQAYVVLLAPVSTDQPNAYQNLGRSLVAAAGLVVRQVDDEAAAAAPVSPQVTIVDRGMRHGYWIRVPNTGGQWSYNFARPEIDVQAAGSSPAEVEATMADVIGRIRSTLAEGQRGVAPGQLIGTTLSPPDPPVLHVRGSRPRALAAIGLLGGGLTLALIVSVDQWVIRRAVRSPRTPPGAGPAGAAPVLRP